MQTYERCQRAKGNVECIKGSRKLSMLVPLARRESVNVSRCDGKQSSAQKKGEPRFCFGLVQPSSR